MSALCFDKLRKRHLVFKSNATVFECVVFVAQSAPSPRFQKLLNVDKFWELQ